MKKLAAQLFAIAAFVFLTIIWWGHPNAELVWYLLPIAGAFRMIGGTWSHDVGRFGYVGALCLAYLMFIGWTWWLLLIALAYFGVKTLPFTLIGDSIPSHWLNWAWIWVLGYITASPVIIAGMLTHHVGLTLYACLVPMGVVGMFGTLSNIKATSKVFVWKLCELMMGVSVAYPMCALIQSL